MRDKSYDTLRCASPPGTRRRFYSQGMRNFNVTISFNANDENARGPDAYGNKEQGKQVSEEYP